MRQRGEVDPQEDRPELLGRPDPVGAPGVVGPDAAAHHPRREGGEAVEDRAGGGAVRRLAPSPQGDPGEGEPRGKEAVPQEGEPDVGREPRGVQGGVQRRQPLVDDRRAGRDARLAEGGSRHGREHTFEIRHDITPVMNSQPWHFRMGRLWAHEDGKVSGHLPKPDTAHTTYSSFVTGRAFCRCPVRRPEE